MENRRLSLLYNLQNLYDSSDLGSLIISFPAI